MFNHNRRVAQVLGSKASYRAEEQELTAVFDKDGCSYFWIAKVDKATRWADPGTRPYSGRSSSGWVYCGQ